MRSLDTFWTYGCTIGSPDACWPAKGRLTTKGYGQFWAEGRRHQSHRVAWILTNGPIPDGLEPDHQCLRKDCCNPQHLELVTGLVNIRRSNNMSVRYAARQACHYGHTFTPENTWVSPQGWRYCLTCYPWRTPK